MDICRICLSTATTKDICDLKMGKEEFCKNYIEIFSFCLDIKINEESKGRQLCSRCFERMLQFYKFKKLALKNDAYFRAVESKTCTLQLSCDEDNVGLSDDDVMLDESHKSPELIQSNILLVEYLDQQDDEEPSKEFEDEVLDNEYKDKSFDPDCENEDGNSTDTDSSEAESGGRERIRTKKNKDGTCVCLLCEITFPNRSKIRRHIVLAHGYLCQYCSARRSTIRELEEHIRIHTQEKPCVCPHCNQAFRTDYSLQKHITIHTGERKFSCKECGKKFRLPSNLQYHLLTHSKERRFECHYCSKRFSLKFNLRTHLKNIHHDMN